MTPLDKEGLDTMVVMVGTYVLEESLLKLGSQYGPIVRSYMEDSSHLFEDTMAPTRS